MQYALEQFIDEAIELELNAAAIYAIFSKAIPEDANFWAGLAWEERSHASILKTGKDVLVPRDQFPVAILPDFVQLLVETNRWLRSLMEEFSQAGPDRQTAFGIALKIEESAGEQHFQRVMAAPTDSKIITILQELCEEDLHHMDRIRAYMQDAGIVGQHDFPEKERRKILIVINDASVAKLLKTILEPEGRIDSVLNGGIGVEKIKEQEYRLIIAAADLPIDDGIKFYRAAKEICPDLQKRFLFFINAPTPEQLAFFEKENLRYLAKPASIGEIRQAAVSILGDRP